MLYGLDDLVTEIAYACALRKSEVKRFYHALVQQLEHLMRQGKGARCPGLGRWSFLANSRRQKGSAVGMDIDEDLRAAWFIGFAFEADPTFLRAHSLAAAPARRRPLPYEDPDSDDSLRVDPEHTSPWVKSLSVKVRLSSPDWLSFCAWALCYV